MNEQINKPREINNRINKHLLYIQRLITRSVIDSLFASIGWTITELMDLGGLRIDSLGTWNILTSKNWKDC